MASPSNLRGFALTSFFNDVASEMAYWILPAFVVAVGGGPAQLGIIEGIAEAMAAFTKLASGYLTDRLRRRKPLVLGGYFVANAVKPLLAISTAWWHVLLIRFADRTSKGLRGSARDVMLADSVAANKLGSAYGFVQAADSAGAILGPLLAWLLLRQAHWDVRSVFWAAAIPGALCVWAFTFLVKEPRKDPRHGPHITASASIKLPLPRSFWIVLLPVLIFSIGNSSDMFLILRAKDVGIAVAFAPLLGLVFNVTYTALSWPAGALSDKFSRHTIAALGYFIYAAAYATFAFAPNRLAHAKLALWLAMALYGFYYALTEPVLKALIVSSVGREVRGRAIGIFSFVISICLLTSSAATGFLWKRFGAQLPLGISAACALTAAIMLLVIGINAKPRQSD
ncbi:MAG: MFS transporter [Acidobacteriaceae bacterium]